MSRIGTIGLLSSCGLCRRLSERRAGAASSEYRADQAEARNMRLVGYNDLQARSAYSR